MQKGIGARRHNVLQQRVGVGANSPAGLKGRIDERIVVGDHYAEFVEGAIDLSVDQKEVGRLPCDVGSGGLGLQSALKRAALARDISRNLILAGEVEPVMRVVGIKLDGRLKARDCGLRIVGDEGLVAAEAMVVVGVPGREANGTLELG